MDKEEIDDEDSSTMLVINHFPLNKGNHAILRTIIGVVEEHDKDIDLLVSSYDKELTEDRDEVKSCIWPFNAKKVVQKNSIVTQGLTAVIEAISSLVLFFFPSLSKKSEEIYPYFEEADVVVCPGGHLFTTMNPLISVWTYSFSVLLAKKLNKPVIGHSQTIGPFEGISKWISKFLSKKAIKKMDPIFLREKSSEEVVKKMGLEEKEYSFAGETAYLLNKVNKEYEEDFSEIEKDKTNIGLTIHHLYYRYHMSREKYVDIMSDFCEHLADHVDEPNIVFVPMEYTKEGPKDRQLIHEIIDNTDCEKDIQVIKKDLKPEQLHGFMQSLDFFVGTKTHSIVMSLVSCTPTISVSYHDKSNFFMEEWDVGSYTIDLKDVNTDDLMDLFEKLSNNEEKVKETLLDSRKKMEKYAEKNFEAVWKELQR